MAKFIASLEVITNGEETWEDVEWAINDLFYDDEQGKPNFTIGTVCVTVEEIKPRTISEEKMWAAFHQLWKTDQKGIGQVAEYNKEKWVKLEALILDSLKERYNTGLERRKHESS